ncbi:hypothetical protein SK128_004312 [Halocaridina rubra]|uniref:Translation initiation factor IF-3 n=1 Tax=Halocaridina rubra TaxID=373956 RepID=A0AAN8WRG5_HALRR
MVACCSALSSNSLLASRYLMRKQDRISRIISTSIPVQTEIVLPLTRSFFCGFPKNFASIPEEQHGRRYSYSRRQPFDTPLASYTFSIQKRLFSTGPLMRYSDIFEPKSNSKPSGGKDKATQAKEKESLKKYREDDSPQIMLIESEGKYIPVTLKQAERMAKRRDLKLIQVEDPTMMGKTKKSVYKLITGKQYFEINMAKKASKPSPGIKGEKLLSINGTIAEHDLKGKLHNIEKWLKKGFQTKVTISAGGASKEHMEGLFAKIEQEVVNMQGRIVQRREKLDDIKFFIAPPKVEKKKVKQLDENADSSKNITKGREESG